MNFCKSGLMVLSWFFMLEFLCLISVVLFLNVIWMYGVLSVVLVFWASNSLHKSGIIKVFVGIKVFRVTLINHCVSIRQRIFSKEGITQGQFFCRRNSFTWAAIIFFCRSTQICSSTQHNLLNGILFSWLFYVNIAKR